MGRLPGIIARFVLTLTGLAVVLAIGVGVAVNVSPKPFAWYVKRQFSTGIGIKPVTPPLYRELGPRVRVERDIEYPSRFGDNRLDVFVPKDADGPLPTILWIHGGGFIGGDKDGIETWATMVAAKGYAVVSINYELAPHNHYPGPVIQFGDAYEFLKRESQRFPAIDPHRLIVGGDSAGAQIASQFAAVQTNPALAKLMRLEPVVAQGDLIGAVLYCGPYDLRGLYDTKSRFSRFFVRQVGWTYFDVRDWRDTPQAAQATMIDHVTPAYPPTFVTDGNSGSFEADAKQLEAKLKANGVPVDSLYYPIEHGMIGHEYQFDYALPESIEAYGRTLDFLTRITAGN